MKTAGYSGTPLVQKLGIKPRHRVAFLNAPRGFAQTLGKLPEGVSIVRGEGDSMDFILLFAKSAKVLAREFHRHGRRLAPTGMLWVGWPKKASGVESDLSDEVVRKVGLDAGLVDVKVCAIDCTWSGLKFVIPLKDRPR